MPTRKPADVWEAPDNIDTRPAPTPAPAPATEPAPTIVDTPPGPIQLELTINNRIHFAQRVYSYKIDQTHPTETVITAHLTPAAVRND